MAFYPVSGQKVLNALGISAEGVSRVVIDIKAGTAIKVYVTSDLPADAVPAVVDAAFGAEVVKTNVTVDEKANITRKP